MIKEERRVEDLAEALTKSPAESTTINAKIRNTDEDLVVHSPGY